MGKLLGFTMGSRFTDPSINHGSASTISQSAFTASTGLSVVLPAKPSLLGIVEILAGWVVPNVRRRV